MSTDDVPRRPRAALLADGARALADGEAPPSEALRRGVDADEEVLVPVGGDGSTPMGMDDADGPALVAFTDLDRLGWAMPDGPRVALVPIRHVLGLVVRVRRPLRLDATTGDEVRILPGAAAALLEGRDAETGLTHTGARYRPPPGPTASPEDRQDDDAEAPAGHPPARYGEDWDPATGLQAPLDVDEARARHGRGERYVAIIDHPDGRRRVVDVSGDRVVTRVLDAAGRTDMVLGFVLVDGRLFEERLEMVTRSAEDGAEEARHVVLTRPDGTMRVVATHGESVESHDLHDVDVSGNWRPPLELGDYRWVIDPR